MEGSCDIRSNRESPALLAGNANGTDTPQVFAFEPSQHITIGLSVKASNGPGRTANRS
jgi:hypothetical protein